MEETDIQKKFQASAETNSRMNAAGTNVADWYPGGPYAFWNPMHDMLIIYLAQSTEIHIRYVPLIPGMRNVFDVLVPSRPEMVTEDLPTMTIPTADGISEILVAGFAIHIDPQQNISEHYRNFFGVFYKPIRSVFNNGKIDLSVRNIVSEIFYLSALEKPHVPIQLKDYQEDVMRILRLHAYKRMRVHIPFLSLCP